MKNLLRATRRRAGLLLAMLAMGLTVFSQSNLVVAEYFFNEDPGPGNGTAVTFDSGINIDITVEAPAGLLLPGYHRISFRFKSADGNWGTTSSRQFYVNGPSTPLVPNALTLPVVYAEYFWNSDPGPGEGEAFYIPAGFETNVSFTPNAPAEPGLQRLGIRTKDLGGVWSTTRWTTVLVIGDAGMNAPEAAFVYNPSPTVFNVLTAFDDASVNVSTDALIQWDMNMDGVADYIGDQVFHAFTSPGIKQVRQTVINPPSMLAQLAVSRLYFTNGSLNDAGGAFGALAAPSSIVKVDGRQGDMQGAFKTGPELIQGNGSGESLSQFTVSFWFKGSSGSNGIQVGTQNGAQFRAFFSGVNHRLGNTNISAGSSSVIFNQQWHHIALTYAQGVAQTYLDGVAVATANISGALPFKLDTLTIGGVSSTSFANGIFDDFLFFGSQLSPVQIALLASEVYAGTSIQNVVVGPLQNTQINLIGDTVFCSGESSNLFAPEADSYFWNTGASTQNITVSSSGSYACFFSVNGEDYASDPLEITVLPTPQVLLTVYNATNGLANGSAGVSISGGSSFLYSYLWSTGANVPSVTSLVAGSYQVTASDGFCPVELPVDINNIVVPAPIGVYNAEYFFNADPGPGNGTIFQITQGDEAFCFADISTTGLAQGLHTLSVRVQNDFGTWGSTRSRVFSISTPIEEPYENLKVPILAGEYFFDGEDPGPGNATTFDTGTPSFDINTSLDAEVSELGTGFHRISFRIKDNEGTWSPTRSALFSIELIFPPSLPDFLVNLTDLEYFIGSIDPGPGNGIALPIPSLTAIDVNRSIDLSDFPTGEYLLSIRTRDIGRQWGVTKTIAFEIDSVECAVPQVDFAFNAANAGVPVQFSNISTNLEQNANFFWDINADGTVEYTTENASHTFAFPGTYDVAFTVDNGMECTVTVIRQVQIGPVLSTALAASGPLEFCQGGSVILSAPGGSGYLWSNYLTNQSITVTESGIYQCIYTNLQGDVVQSSSIEVVVNPVMNINLMVNNATNGMPNGSAGLMVSGGSAFFYDYQWSTGSILASEVNLTPGMYQVEVSDGICPEILDVSIGNTNTAPDFGISRGEYFWDNNDPGTGNAISFAVPQELNTSTFANVSTAGLEVGLHLLSVRMAYATGEWSTTRTSAVRIGVGVPVLVEITTELAEIVAGEYFLDGVDPGTGNGTPFPAISPSIEASLSEIISPIAIGLSPGFHTLHVRVKAIDGAWSATRSSLFFIQDISLPSLPEVMFPIVRAEYYLGNIDPGAGNGIPVLTPVGNEVNFPIGIDLSGLVPGIYTYNVRVQDIAGHWSTIKRASLTVVPVSCPVPVVAFEFTDALPGGLSTLTSTSQNVIAEATYAWDFDGDGLTDAEGDQVQFTVPSVGEFGVTLTVSNGNECIASLVQYLAFGTLQSNEITANGPLAFCAGESVALTAPFGSGYIWSDGSTQATLTVSESGTYAVSYINLAGVPSVSNYVDVTVYPILQVVSVTNSETNGLGNGSAGVLVSGGSTFLYDYLWSTGAQTPIITQLNAGTYSVQISDPHCPDEVELTILNENVNDGVASMEYFWNNQDPGPGNGIFLPVTQGATISAFGDIETAGLEPGYHFLHFRAKDFIHGWGTIRTLPVYLWDTIPNPPKPEIEGIIALEYFYDADPGATFASELVVSTGPSIFEDYELETDGLAPGEHILSVRVLDNNGNWSVTRSRKFNTCNPPNPPLVVEPVINVCSGGNVSLEAIYEGFNLTWILPDSSIVNGTTVALANVDLTLSGTYLVYAESEPGCFGQAAEVVVNVLQAPVITSLITGPNVVCPSTDIATLFIAPVPFATLYDWNLPAGTEIISGNNTNNIALDFSEVQAESALISLTVSNGCGIDISSVFVVSFECDIDCNVVAGTVSSFGTLNPCIGDGEPSIIQLSVSGNLGNGRFGIVKLNGDIVAVNSTGTFNMENYAPDSYRLGHISFDNSFTLAGVTNASQFTGCFKISNLINVNSFTPVGGTISAQGSTTICRVTSPPTIIPFSVLGSVGPNKRWVVLNQNFTEILALSQNSNFNWNNFAPGTYRVVHVSYGNNVNLASITPPNLEGCISASNSLTINVVTCPSIQLQSHPSPTEGISYVEFSIPEAGPARLEVYDLSGRLLATLFKAHAEALIEYRFVFDGGALPNGIYLYRLSTSSAVLIDKFVLAR